MEKLLADVLREDADADVPGHPPDGQGKAPGRVRTSDIHDIGRKSHYAGVSPVRLPRKSPNLNAYAERFVLSIKSECPDRMVMLGERHLR